MNATYYPMPEINETTSLFGFFKYVNIVADGLFFFMITIVVWVISFLVLRGESSARGFFVASFFCTVLSIVLSISGLLAPKFMYLFIILSAIGMIWLNIDKE